MTVPSEAPPLPPPLRAPGSTSSLVVYLSRLWEMRHYAWASARHGLRSSTASTVIGQFWLLLEPAILIAIYWMIFGVVLGVDRGMENFVAFLTVGQIFFRHSRLGIIQASSSLVTNAPILRSFSFPRAVLPLSQTLRAFANFRFSLVVLALVMPLMGVMPRISWLLAAPLIALQLCLNFGLGLLLARPVTRFADLRKAMQYIFQVIFYGSGVFFPIDRFVGELEHGQLLLQLVVLNPFYSLIGLARWAIIGMRPEHAPSMLISLTVWAMVSLVLGLLVFVRGEGSHAAARTVKLDP